MDALNREFGTSFNHVIGTFYNALLEHPTERGSRISLVFRDIKTQLPWGEINKKIKKSQEKKQQKVNK
jgi:hypothetical protein